MTAKELARGRAEAPGAGTIINAMATGRGAAFAIDLKVTASVSLNETGRVSGRIADDHEEKTDLIEVCVRKVLQTVARNYGAVVETASDIPIARGLSSSSACSNAAVLAAASALRKLGHATPNREELIGIGIDASMECRVSVTGAFDDACASFYGGAVVTDNSDRRILRRQPMPQSDAVVLVPRRKSYSGRVDLARLRLLAPQVQIAHEEALRGELLKAMTLNGLIYCASLGYDPSPAMLALGAGALAVSLSGKGPAFVALTHDGTAVKRAWSELGHDVIITRTNNVGSRVLE